MFLNMLCLLFANIDAVGLNCMISNLLVMGTAVLIQIKRGRTATFLLACDAFFVDRAGHFLAEIRGAKRREWSRIQGFHVFIFFYLPSSIAPWRYRSRWPAGSRPWLQGGWDGRLVARCHGD
jgi:hypothetical protein